MLSTLVHIRARVPVAAQTESWVACADVTSGGVVAIRLTGVEGVIETFVHVHADVGDEGKPGWASRTVVADLAVTCTSHTRQAKLHR